MAQVSLQRTLRYTTILCGMVAFSFTPAFANPVGGSVAGGSASISQIGNTLTVQQTSNKAIINWQGFDIASDETTQFVQPSSNSIALNRISENTPSQIDGTLTANGNVILINPNGVVFGATSHVDVNSLVVSSSDVNDNDFMANATPAFNQPGSVTAQIVANGRITVAQAGLVGLVAPHVENNGTITATLGTVMLASGDTFTLDLAGDGLTNIAVTGTLQQQLAQNSGVINAQGGKIEITAAAARDVLDSLVANSGTLEADSFQQQGGTIILSATGGTVTNTGTIEARGLAPFQSGGSVTVAANNIHQDGTINVDGQAKGGSVAIAFTGSYDDNAASLISANAATGAGGAISIQGGSDTATLDAFGTYNAVSAMCGGGQISLAAGGYVSLHGAELDTSGAAGGGAISIGYDATGARNTADVTIDAQSKLLADATNNGNGGSISIGANDAVNVSGSLSAQGGANGGRGGNINISFGNLYADSASALLTVASPAGQGGGIFIEGDDNASLTASGTYISDGQTTGGTISLLAGQDIFLLGALLRNEGPLGGGTIRIGGDFEGDDDVRRSQYTYVDKNTRILADATNNGDGGNVAVWSDDCTDFEGFISARGGPNGGNGGYVETSGKATLNVGDNALINTSAALGNAGTWLLDPEDFTIASSGGDMTGATLTANLETDNVTILSSSGATSGTGSIYVNDIVSWSSHTLTLTAADNIVVSAAMTATGTAALTLNTATANGSDSAVAGGSVSMAMASGGGFSGHIDYSSSGTLTINSHAYTVINSLGSAGSTTGTDLQGMQGNLSGYYALGADIDASATSGWNSGAGFTPIGNSSTTFTGQFEGLGHTISNLTINNSSATYVGLFGHTGSGVKINDVGLSGGSVIGSSDVGELVGSNGGTLSNSYATGNVTGTGTGIGGVGGLVGFNPGTINNSYATGAVSGSNYVGGLVGNTIGGSDITNSFWDTQTSGTSTGVGHGTSGTATPETTAGMQTLSTFTGASWSINGNATGSATTWYLASGAYPVLRSVGADMPSGGSGTITLTMSGQSVTYGTAPNLSAVLGTTYSFSCSDSCSSSVLTTGPTLALSGGTGTSGSGNYNVGSWTIGGSGAADSNGFTIDYISGTLTVNAKVLTVSGETVNGKTYDGTTAASLSLGSATLSGVVSGDTVGVSGSGYTATFASVNAGTESVTVSNLGLSGADAGDYTLTQPTGLSASIAQAALTIEATNQNRTYGFGGTSAALGTTGYNITSGTLASGDAITGVALSTNDTTSGSGNYNAGTYNLTPSMATGTGGFNTTNYAITYAGDTGGLAVNQKALTVSGLTATNKTYDGLTTDTLGGTAAFSGKIAGDNVALGGTASGAFADANVGNGKAVTVSGNSISGADAGNYSFTQEQGQTANITQASLTITAGSQSATYGDGALVLGAGETTDFSVGSGLVSGQNVTSVTLATTDATSGSGNYDALSGGTITPSAAAGTGGFLTSNYNITYAAGTLNIARKSLTVSGVSGTDKTYDGTASDPLTGTAALAGNISGDNVTLGGSGTGTLASANAGPEAVTVSGYSVSGADAGNYTLTAPTTTATIAQKALTITANDVSRAYGAPNSFTVSYSGFVGGDTVSVIAGAPAYTTSATQGSNVGDYTVTPSLGTLSATNYSFTGFNAGTLTITKASLVVTPDDLSKVYDTANPTLTGTVSGLYAPDDITAGYSTTAMQQSAVGGYPITAALSDPLSRLGNYNVTYNTGTLTITSASSQIVVPPTVINPTPPDAPVTPPASPPPADPSPPFTVLPGSPVTPPDATVTPAPPVAPVNRGSSSPTPTQRAVTNSRNPENGNIDLLFGIPLAFQTNITRQIQAVMERDRLFLSLQSQLDTLEAPVSKQSQRVRHIIIPGVVAFSVLSIGYVLLFSRALYAVLASVGLVSVRQKLDPAALLEYWESESRERSFADEGDKDMEGMFG